MLHFKPLIVILAALFFLGCEAPPEKIDRAKQIDEKVTQSEFEKYQEVMNELIELEISEFPLVYLGIPQWDPDRSLPVKELVKEEKQRLSEKWQIEMVLRQLKKNRKLIRVLVQKKLSPEKFIGLTLTLGAASSRSQVASEEVLETAIEKGKSIVAVLENDSRPFASLDEEDRQTVLRNAIWITRMDRALRISDVPPENLALIRENQELISKILPKQFLDDPLASAVDLLEERGLPFEEMKVSGFDDEMQWSRKNAIIGTDRPDEIDSKKQ